MSGVDDSRWAAMGAGRLGGAILEPANWELNIGMSSQELLDWWAWYIGLGPSCSMEESRVLKGSKPSGASGVDRAIPEPATASDQNAVSLYRATSSGHPSLAWFPAAPCSRSFLQEGLCEWQRQVLAQEIQTCAVLHSS